MLDLYSLTIPPTPPDETSNTSSLSVMCIQLFIVTILCVSVSQSPCIILYVIYCQSVDIMMLSRIVITLFRMNVCHLIFALHSTYFYVLSSIYLSICLFFCLSMYLYFTISLCYLRIIITLYSLSLSHTVYIYTLCITMFSFNI